MSCATIFARAQNGTLFCSPTAAERNEFIQCAVQRMCNVYQQMTTKQCKPVDTLFLGVIAALALEAKVNEAACQNQPPPGGFGQPCAPGTPCCPSCVAPFACNGSGTCCPNPMTAGSPCGPNCPCPAPMQCVNGACVAPCDQPMVEGSPCGPSCACPDGMACANGTCCLQNGWPCDPFSKNPAPCKVCPAGKGCEFKGSCLVRYQKGNPLFPETMWWDKWGPVTVCDAKFRAACKADPYCQMMPDTTKDEVSSCES